MAVPILKTSSRWRVDTIARLSYLARLAIHLSVNRRREIHKSIITDIDERRPMYPLGALLNFGNYLAWLFFPSAMVVVLYVAGRATVVGRAPCMCVYLVAYPHVLKLIYSFIYDVDKLYIGC